MKSQRQNQPQFELPVVGLEFNLQAERGTDFNRIACERQQAEADRAAAEKRQPTLEEIFGQPIASYSRRLAIEDGVLVDLMQGEMARAVRDAGFRYPMAMTIGAFTATVSEIDKPLPDGQDIQGRLWDVLWMVSLAVKGTRERSHRASFRVVVWDGNRHNEVKLWSLCGPGHDGAPVITIMLEGED
jgi:hypothetical protein